MTINRYKYKIAAIVLCAGSGLRSGLAYNKLLHSAGSKTVLELTLDALAGTADLTVCVHSARDRAAVLELTGGYENVRLCEGGDTRTQSVRNALAVLPDSVDIVVIHDGARPFVTREIIESSISSAIECGSGIAAVKTVDAIKESADGKSVLSSPDKRRLYNAQTPQTFRLREIKDAYARIPGDYGDDSEVYQRAGYTPTLIGGDYANIKITTAEDLLKLPGAALKIGVGFDVHRLAENRKLILGGVTLPFEKGLLGHSDADVLTHAVMDALLSAAGLPDIGVLFPDTDEKYKGADSILLLKEVAAKALENGYTPHNISAVIMAERPKLAGYIPQMRQSLAAAIGIKVSDINISATTTEKLGIVGNGEGMAASCVCLVRGAHAGLLVR